MSDSTGGDQILDMDQFIKFPSHRQREKALAVIGIVQEYYSLRRSTGYGVVKVTGDQLAALQEAEVRFSRIRPPWGDLLEVW